MSELKRTGLAKRIVGVHFSGYHDGQFLSPYPDFSDCAKAEYGRYQKESPPIGYEYEAFSRILGFRAQEDFAREFKAAMGKDTIAIRWCMGPFLRALDLTAFAFSDVIDICVPQPTYETRRPGMVMEPKLPFSSFDLHCKMYWNELDFRTYGALETWARPGVVATKGLGQSDDFAMWRTVYRKAAGMTTARHSGYWFYDMGGGWFSPPEIARDIGEVVKVQADLLSGKPSAWRPSVAVVADEAGLGMCIGKKRHPFVMQLFRRQLSLFAASGVPYEFYLAEDALRNPSLLYGCRTVVFGFFRSFDERRKKLVDALARDGRTLVFLSESGVEGGAFVTGFDLAYSTNSMPHEIVPESEMVDVVRGLMVSERRRHHPNGPEAVVRGPRVAVCEKDGVIVLARFASDGAPALAMREDSECRRVYVCEPSGLSPGFFNRLVRESGAYVPVTGSGLQVDMNGSFISVHALKNGEWDFRLPFPCRVVNVKSGREELVPGGVVHLALTAGETCWFRLYNIELQDGKRNM